MRREEESKRGKRDHAHAQRCRLTGNGTSGGRYWLCRNGGRFESFECGLCRFGVAAVVPWLRLTVVLRLVSCSCPYPRRPTILQISTLFTNF